MFSDYQIYLFCICFIYTEYLSKVGGIIIFMYVPIPCIDVNKRVIWDLKQVNCQVYLVLITLHWY